MAVEDSNYEVDWQLPPSLDGAHSSLMAPPWRKTAGPTEPGASPAGRTSGEGQVSRAGLDLARVTRLVAEVDAAAVVICYEPALIVERAAGVVGALSPGTRLPVHPGAGGTDGGALASLLAGRLRWCRTIPPPGFRYASLVFAPTLASSGRLVMVANRLWPLTQLNLRLVAAYLAQLDRPAFKEEPLTSMGARPLAQGARVLYL